jgi:hypothetical protein
MNNPLPIPFQRWPLVIHLMMGGFVACAAAAVAGFGLHRADSTLVARASELRTLQNQLDDVRRPVPDASTPNLVHTLPQPSRADDVMRDLGRFSQIHAMTITSVGVEFHGASSTGAAKVAFNIAASADYRTTKALLAELLGRYPTLVMETLALQPQANDTARLDVRVALSLLTRD